MSVFQGTGEATPKTKTSFEQGVMPYHFKHFRYWQITSTWFDTCICAAMSYAEDRIKFKPTTHLDALRKLEATVGLKNGNAWCAICIESAVI